MSQAVLRRDAFRIRRAAPPPFQAYIRQLLKSIRVRVRLSRGAEKAGHSVILKPEDYDRWLEPRNADAESLLMPYSSEEMAMRPVSAWVNRIIDLP